MKRALCIESRLQNATQGMALGHQFGQWSERRWWHFTQEDKRGSELFLEDFLDPEWLKFNLLTPPVITTPGWAPTCYDDLVPYMCALGIEYKEKNEPLSPEMFRNFLLREREWLRPQAVGRNCMELMAEGMNPRIAGLFAPDMLANCWIVWPIAYYHAGYPDHAYEDTILLSHAQTGGESVFLNGFMSALLAAALVPGSTWPEVRDEMLQLADKRNATIAGLIREGLMIAQQAESIDHWLCEIKKEEYRKKTSPYVLDWMSDFYFALSALEYHHLHRMDWVAWVRLILNACDSRFGLMLAMSLRAALEDGDGLPELWKTTIDRFHNTELNNWIKGTVQTIYNKLEKEDRIAQEILPLTIGRETSPLYDKFLAIFLAGAAGNTMGSPVEDRDYPWIVEKYGVLEHIIDPLRLQSEDDAAMAKMWAEMYIRCNDRARVEDLAETFRERMNPKNFYYDTQHAYRLLMQGLPPHACGHWNIVTGSAMMGCYPNGMYHAGDPDLAAADALELVYHYQRGFDVIATAILCAAVAEALRPCATVDSVLQAALKATPKEPQAYFNRPEKRNARAHLQEALTMAEEYDDVLEIRQPLYDHFLEYNGQDPWEVVTYTLAIFKVAQGDIWQCMIGGTNIGRDSDTISSLSAVLAACLKGSKEIPQHLMSLFNEETLEEYKTLSLGMLDTTISRCQRWLAVGRKLTDN